MTFKEGTSLDHMARVKSIIDDSDSCNTYGSFVWEEDIFKKEGSLYQPAGRIILPMSVEGRIPSENGGDRSVAFTVFNEDYFQGLSAPLPFGYKERDIIDQFGRKIDFQCLCDWFPNTPSNNIEFYKGEGVVQTFSRSEDPYHVVRGHVANVLKNLDEITRSADESEVGHLVKRLFVEY